MPVQGMQKKRKYFKNGIEEQEQDPNNTKYLKATLQQRRSIKQRVFRKTRKET